MHENIVKYIRSYKTGVTSKDLAEKFLKFRNPPENIAYAAIYGILSGDRRCVTDESKLWHVVEKKELSSAQLLEKMPLSAVYLLCDSTSGIANVLYVAIWDIFPEPAYKLGVWVSDPSKSLLEGVDLLLNGPEEKYDSSLCCSQLNKLTDQLKDRIPVLFSFDEYRQLSELFTDAEELLTDDNILISELLRAASMEISCPKTLSSLSDVIFNARNFPLSVFRQGERFSECIHELFKILQEKGIQDRDDLYTQCNTDIDTILKNKGFLFEDITKLASAPGVFGFKNRNGSFIHVGKSSNLKRTLLNYFRKSDELSEESYLVQKNCYTFDAYQCGSELECLLFEHRLIKKYLPIKNINVELSKGKELGSSLNDCIIILPHANPKKFMTFWFRKEQKTLMKSFDLKQLNKPGFQKEVEDFFLTAKVPLDNQDVAELEIIVKWKKKNDFENCSIPVRVGVTAEEIFNAVKSYIRVFQEKTA
jgi:hypothetical protein